MRDRPSTTAEAVCWIRAVEQSRPPESRIVDDPYAPLFLGPMMRAGLAARQATGRLGELGEQLLDGLSPYVLARHRFIDDHLATALDEGVAQVLILGAGYDTRAWRFADALAGRPVFELDHPSTSARKAELVERHADALPRPRVVRVPIDFQHQSLAEALEGTGFEPGAPSFVVWEGVTMYLTRAAVRASLAAVRALTAPGSAITMDFWHLPDRPEWVATMRRMSAHALHLFGEPITFGIHPEDVGDFLRRDGWRLTDLADTAELARRHVPDGRRVYESVYAIRAETSAEGPDPTATR
jgi:methyltransferase (TIGR00027 family)